VQEEGVLKDRIEQIQASGFQAVLVFTGGGVRALSDLMVHPGASRFVLEAAVPYGPAALTDWLGSSPEQSVSEEAACALADKALRRAVVLTGGRVPVLGAACTAALQTLRERRGADRVWLAFRTLEQGCSQCISFEDRLGLTRAVQEEELARCWIEALATFIETAGKTGTA
jgi:hypothetical protein